MNGACKIYICINTTLGGKVSVALGTGSGYAYHLSSGQWYTGSYALMGTYWTNAAPQVLDTPVPSMASPSVTPVYEVVGDDWLAAANWFGLVFVYLVPPFVLGVLLRGGKWGLLIGIGIGTALSYVIFPVIQLNVWFVVLVAIGLGAGFVSLSRSGG